MRVTQGMLTQQFLYNITNNNDAMQQLENELSTGKTLNQASDNPLAVSQDMAIKSALSDAQGYQSTVSSGLTWMNDTSSALQSIVTTLQTVRSDVLSGMSATGQSQSGMTALADTVDELQQGVGQLVDSQQGNLYLFGGSNTTTKPTSNLAGATGAINYEISAGVQVQVNVAASDFYTNTSVSGTTQDLQSTLNSIVTDLKSNNSGNLQTDLQNLSAHINNVINLNAELGTRVQRFTAMQSQMTQYVSALSNEKGVIEDADMAQVITQFNTDQTVYTAALKMGSSVLQPSLVDYLPNG